MRYFLCLLIGYFIGTVNPSYIIAKINGFDIRQRGSRNAGASNAVILLGKSVGLVCAIFDIAKPCIAIAISRLVFPDFKLNFALTGCACILGHILPFYMGFKGGKGLACLGGVILAFDMRVFGIMLACELVIALVTKYICLVPMTASVAFAVIYGVMTGDIPGTLLFSGAAVVILWRHVENIRRIRAGKELRLSYLWNKQGEVDRLQKINAEEKEESA
jgi:glycerol-3-phosphate acyltransferase PlsY